MTAAERDASVMQAMWRHFTMISVSTDARPRLKAHRHICLQFTDDQRRLEPWTRGGFNVCSSLLSILERQSLTDEDGESHSGVKFSLRGCVKCSETLGPVLSRLTVRGQGSW